MSSLLLYTRLLRAGGIYPVAFNQYNCRRNIAVTHSLVSKTLEVKSKVFAFKSSRAVQANLQLGTQA